MRRPHRSQAEATLVVPVNVTPVADPALLSASINNESVATFPATSDPPAPPTVIVPVAVSPLLPRLAVPLVVKLACVALEPISTNAPAPITRLPVPLSVASVLWAALVPPLRVKVPLLVAVPVTVVRPVTVTLPLLFKPGLCKRGRVERRTPIHNCRPRPRNAARCFRPRRNVQRPSVGHRRVRRRLDSNP